MGPTATAVTGDADSDHSHSCGQSEKLLGSGYLLEVESTEFPDRSHAVGEGERRPGSLHVLGQ